MSKEVHFQAKIEHEMNFEGKGEHYVFYVKRSSDPETAWGMSVAFKVTDGKMNVDMVEHIRDLAHTGYEIMWKGRE